MKLITIENEKIQAQINMKGGALYTITDKVKNKQLMWEGCDGVWSDRDHVMFPFVCRRINGKYTDGGVEYEMPLHGFVRDMEFTVTAKSENSLTVSVTSNAQTLKFYPHEFVLSVTYRVENNELSVEYEIENLDGREMYFSFGGHLGLKATAQKTEWGEDTKGNFVTFNPPLDTIFTLEGGAFVNAPSKIEPMAKLEVDKSYIVKYDTLILQTKPGSTLLYESGDGDKINFTLSSPVIALWADSKKGGFCCVEPWWGVPDEIPHKADISEKMLMCRVDGNGKYKSGYKLEIIR